MVEQRETLSAMMDGEASEIEVHRLLRQIGEDESMKKTWLSWHQVREIVQSSGPGMRLPLKAHLQLHARIQEAVLNEETYHIASQPTRSFSFYKPAAALALAASIVVAVVVGVQVQQPDQVPLTAAAAKGSAPIDVQPVVAMAPAEGEAADSDLKELDEDGQRRLRAYLQQHDRLARMKDDARLVNYPNSGQ